jgi:hypothetical protein
LLFKGFYQLKDFCRQNVFALIFKEICQITVPKSDIL